MILKKSLQFYLGAMMKISDIFLVKTGQRITEEEVYQHKGDFPCVTSQTVCQYILRQLKIMD